MTKNPSAQPQLLTTDLFGTWRPTPPAKGKKAPKPVNNLILPPVDVEAARSDDADLRAFALQSAPQPSGRPLHRLMGVEALQTSDVATRLKANALADQIARTEGELTPEAVRALLAFSGAGGLGDQSASTNAFYTPTALAKFCWDLASLLKVGPRALEFAAGGGVFLETAPKFTELTAVELDETSSLVTRALYPDVAHHHVPFETYHRQSQDRPFNLVIGNSPYGGRGESGNLDRPQIRPAHWYFTFAGLERLLPGGYMITVVPEAMLRNPSEQKYREEVLDRAHLLGAFLVPEGAFRATGAGVTTAVLVLRRHDAGVYEVLQALTPEQRDQLRAARCAQDMALRLFVEGTAAFRQGKDNLWATAGLFESLAAGKTGVRAGRFGDPVLEGEFGVSEVKMENVAYTLTRRRFDILTRPGLESAIRTLLGEAAAQAVREIPASLHPIQEGQVSPCRRYRFAAGTWRYNGGLNNPALLSALGVARLAVKARGRLLKGDPHLRATLEAAHDAHVQAYGPYDLAMIGKYVPQFPLLRVLVDTSGTPVRVLDDVQRAAIQIHGGTISEVAQQLESYGLLDEHALSAYARVPQVAANAHLLAEYAFDGKLWEANATYYRGNAAQKAQACDTLAAEAQGIRQTALLTQAVKLRAMTPWKDLCDMTLEPRDVLLPEHVLTAWVNAYLGTRTTVKRNQWDQDGVETDLLHASRSSYGVQLRLRNTLQDDWNLADRKVVPSGRVRDLEEYLNYRTPVQSVHDQDAKTETQINAERSAFQLKAVHYERELAAHFRSWLLGSDLAGEVEMVLNEARYGMIPARPDMRALVLDAYKGPLAHPFQAGHVRTAARMDGVILNFDVGLGKTLSAMMLVALLRQSGRAQLPAIVVTLSRLGDWVMNAATALPGYRVLVIGGEPLRDAQGKFLLNEDGEPEVREDTGAQRRVKIASLLTDAPDLIIFTAEAFEMIPMLHATHKSMIESNLSLMGSVGTADTFDDRHRKLGGHKALAKYESSLARHLNRVSVAEETDIPFEALGIDAVISDECHMYKNSHAAPRVYGESSPKFLGGGGESNRALDALHKYRFVRAQGGLTAGLTATFFGNSPLEIFNMLALHTDALAKYGIPDVSTFVARFCVIEPRLIIQPSGEVEYVPCVIGFRNFDELRAILGQHIIKETELSCQMHDGVGLKLPPLEAIEHVFDLPQEVMDVYEAEQMNLNAPDSEGENHIFSIYARLLKLTLHPPLMGVDAPNIRFETCVQACLEARAQGGSNLVFMYTGGENAQTYHALKTALVAAGYPAGEIEIITAQTHPGGGERLKVERRVRRGELTCVIGSKVIEEGGNYQGITDLHHMDYPYHHQAFVQRIGRARRQGTWVKVVRNHVYFARGSFDAVRYQLMLGKKGWADQVYDLSVNSCEFEGVGFSGEDLAVMFSRNPEATRAEIAVKKEERAQQAREANMRADLGIIREYLDNLRELSRRHAKSLTREKGPSTQDRVGIAHLTRVVRGLHTQVEKLRAAGHPMAAITRLNLPVVWAGGLPLHKGLTLSLHGQQGVVVEALEGRGEITVTVGTNTGSWEVAKLLDAKDVQPTVDAAAFGTEAFERLAPSLREGVLSGLSDGAQEELLTGALGALPVVAEVQPVLVVTPAVPMDAVAETAALVMEALPVVEAAPVVRLSARFGLSVAAQLPQEAEQVFAIQGDHLEPGADGDMLLALVLRPNGEVRQVTVVLRDEARLAQARTLMCSGSTRLRERVMHLLSAA